MADHCTIFCAKECGAEVTSAIRGRPDVVISGPADCWETIVVRASESVLTFTSLRFSKPQDKFSKIVLGAVNLARKGAPGPVREEVIERIGKARLIIGVTAEPEFEDEHDDWMTWIASVGDGVVLLQDASFTNAQGDIVLECDS
jgi:hypothetical protein